MGSIRDGLQYLDGFIGYLAALPTDGFYDLLAGFTASWQVVYLTETFVWPTPGGLHCLLGCKAFCMT